MGKFDISATMPCWGWWLLGVFVVLLVLYIVIICQFADRVLISKKVADTAGSLEADLLYFLPAASLHVTATAKVSITTDVVSGAVLSKDIYEFSLDMQVQLQADSTALYQACYQPSWFASDDLKLAADAGGLLTSISVTAEDRAPAIFSQLTDAPKKILSPDKSPAIGGAVVTPVKVTNLPPFTRSFVLYPDDLMLTKKEIPWKITLDNLASPQKIVADASVRLVFNQTTRVLEEPEKTGDKDKKKPGRLKRHRPDDEIPGILSRPLRNLQVTVYLADQNADPAADTKYQAKAGANYELMVPDTARTLTVALKRSPFVKRVMTPKFSSGLLIENDITKPSELESILAIPVNVLKAIVSIPAELLSFKIAHITQQSSMETAQQKLLTDTLAYQKAARDAQAQAAKDKADAEKAGLDAQQANINNTQSVLQVQQEWAKQKKEVQDMLDKLHKADTSGE